MFYNNFRSTRSALKEEQRRNIRNNIINPKERLMNHQKRKKLKDLLIHKFMDKYSELVREKYVNFNGQKTIKIEYQIIAKKKN